MARPDGRRHLALARKDGAGRPLWGRCCAFERRQSERCRTIAAQSPSWLRRRLPRAEAVCALLTLCCGAVASLEGLPVLWMALLALC